MVFILQRSYCRRALGVGAYILGGAFAAGVNGVLLVMVPQKEAKHDPKHVHTQSHGQ